MARKRWICPDCGSGVLAPSKPRRDDVRRYCLDCSKRTGRLVERICPALEAQRQRKQEQRAAKNRRRRAAARRKKGREAEERKKLFDERSLVDDLNLHKEARKMWRTAALRDARKTWHAEDAPLPEITIRQSTEKRYTSGTCHQTWHLLQRRITMTLCAQRNAPEILTTLLHEMAHAACPWKEHHGSMWKSVYLAAARELFGEVKPRGRSSREYDRAVWEASELWWMKQQGVPDIFEDVEKPAEPGAASHSARGPAGRTLERAAKKTGFEIRFHKPYKIN